MCLDNDKKIILVKYGVCVRVEVGMLVFLECRVWELLKVLSRIVTRLYRVEVRLSGG